MHKNSDVLALGRSAAFALVLFVGMFQICSANTVVNSVSIYSDSNAALIVPSVTLHSAMTLGVGAWVKVSTSPNIGDYAVAVTSAGENIYIANSTTDGSNYFMRYNTITRSWSSTSNIPQWFKNGTAMAWDQDKYIYVFMGASYSDTSRGGRFYFYRYNIATNTWTQLQDTPKTNGAGDALCFVPGSVLGVNDDNFIYAILGNGSVGSNFYRYSIKTNTWSAALNFPWSATDDGCSLVWTGDNYLYALRGEYIETTPCYDFSRYDLRNDSWTSKAPIPAYPHDGGSGGVGDGGSLVWVGGARSNYIYALSGNQAYPESPNPIWDNRFYLYTISTDSWERLADLPAGVGDQNGPRLAFANENIYYWRGCNKDGSLYAYSVDTLAPAAPGLLAPPDNTITNDDTPTFVWTSVSDPSGVTYQIQIDDDEDFSSPLYYAVDLADNAHTLPDGNALASGKYFWRVRARDGVGNVGDWSESRAFTVMTSVSFTLELRAGWNMVSFPVMPDDADPDSVFSGYYAMFRWSAASQSYVLCGGSSVEPDEPIAPGVGYWINVLAAENVVVSGTPVDSLTLSLSKGWNMIGLPYGGASIADPDDTPNNSVLPLAFTWTGSAYASTQQLEAGKGYWVNALNDCVLRL